MKTLILAVVAGIFVARPAQAQMQQFVMLSSATFCNVSVSTSAATRVDNFGGLCNGLMPTNRNEVEVCVPTGGTTVNCAFDNTVSTLPASIALGKEVTAGPANCMKEWLPTWMKLWCMSQTKASAQMVYVKQGRAIKK